MELKIGKDDPQLSPEMSLSRAEYPPERTIMVLCAKNPDGSFVPKNISVSGKPLTPDAEDVFLQQSIRFGSLKGPEAIEEYMRRISAQFKADHVALVNIIKESPEGTTVEPITQYDKHAAIRGVPPPGHNNN